MNILEDRLRRDVFQLHGDPLVCEFTFRILDNEIRSNLLVARLLDGNAERGDGLIDGSLLDAVNRDFDAVQSDSGR